MKTLLPCLLTLLTLFGQAAENVTPIVIGSPAPDFKLLGTDEQQHILADYAKADVLMVAFLSNHCPTSHAIEARLKKLLADYKGKGFQVVAINPNHPDGLKPDELGYSKYNDSFPEMKLYAKDAGFTFDYLYDGDTQGTAKAYGALATPHVFIFDMERKLRYQGRFDDSRFKDEATVTSPDARNAVEALLAGKEVPVAETKPHGCSTKWMSKKNDIVKADNEKWEKGEVDVEIIDAAGVAALRKNGTKKVRMFNVWATWCGPCVEEFPELVKTSRKFGLRDFEFITISMDDPTQLKDVKKFLEEQNNILPGKLKPTLQAEGRKTNNYVFKSANSDELIQALDPQWKGPIPFTLIVAPDGTVVHRLEGGLESAADGDKLRQIILDYMGDAYVPEK